MSAPSGTGRRPGYLAGTGRHLLRSPLALASFGWLLLVIVTSSFATVIAPYPAQAQDLASRLQGPTAHHLLGTDDVGRDVLSRLLYGGGTLLWGAALATVVAMAIGIPAGLVAGYAGKRLGAVLEWLADLSFALPVFVLIVALAVIYPDNTAILMTAVGVAASGGVLRLVRNSTRVVRTGLFVDAAEVAGLDRRRILTRHILPSVAPPLFVQGALGMSTAVLLLASLSFLGLGESPQVPGWGQMIFVSTQNISTDPWLMVATGIPLILTIMALNFIGASLRDASPDTRRASQLPSGGPRARAVDPVVAPPVVGDPDAGLLVVRGLTVAFPGPDGEQVVVDGVDLDVGTGETVGLVGESGCGKSVTALATIGLVPPPGHVVGGSLRFDGSELAGAGEAVLGRVRGSRIGFVSQEPVSALDPSFTVGSQLSEVLRRHRRTSRRAARARVVELLGEVGLGSPDVVARSYPHQISGGMAQRVAIAMALCGEPALLVADEPTTALDVTVQAEILDLLRHLQETRRMSVLLVTHDLGVVADSCRTAAVMYAGQIVERGPVDEVLAAPRHPYTVGLLHSLPGAAAAGDPLQAIEGTVPAPRDWPTGCRFASRCPLVEDACRAAPVAMVEIGEGRRSRCLRTAELAGPEERVLR